MIIWFTLHQTLNLPKWMFFQKPFFKSSLLLNGQRNIHSPRQQRRTLPSLLSDYFSMRKSPLCIQYLILHIILVHFIIFFLFCLYPSSMTNALYTSPGQPIQIGLGDFVPGTNFKGMDGEMNKVKLIINFVYLLGESMATNTLVDQSISKSSEKLVKCLAYLNLIQ